MPRSEFENGIPYAQLQETKFDTVQRLYGQFALSVLQEVQELDQSAPKDIVTVGDNWYQLASQGEQLALPDPAKLSSGMYRGDTWPIFTREPEETMFTILKYISSGVQHHNIDKRILAQMAVLDLTKNNPILPESMWAHYTDTPWGENGVLPGSRTKLYHISSGFHRYEARTQKTPRHKNIDSVTIFLRQGKKFD